MKKVALSCTMLSVVFGLNGTAQEFQPITAEEAGLTPLSETVYVNPLSTVNNGNVESLGVDITGDENVVIGWEDDGDGLLDFSAVWTLFDLSGNLLTPDTEVTSTQTSDTAALNFLSYFRSDGSATPNNTAWGPKIKANRFGDGFGMGATAFSLGLEIEELADVNLDAGGGGDFPAVQILTNSGDPVLALSGVSEEWAEPEGDIRVADFDFLSNGNIVIVGESRQQDDLVVEFNGSTPANHAVYSVFDADGNVVKDVSLVSATAEGVGMWHGAGVTANGFGLRFALNGRTTVRLFDNNGEPITDNIDIATLTGDEFTAGGGRGDSAGFHGNGEDAYLTVNTADIGGNNATFVTVLNADGSLRYSREATDDFEFSNSGRVDAAMDAEGKVLAVFADNEFTVRTFRTIQARLFDPAGEPLTDTFFISERPEETSFDALSGDSRQPRAAFRGNKLAVVWRSGNSGDPVEVVAVRTFQVGEDSHVDHFMLYE